MTILSKQANGNVAGPCLKKFDLLGLAGSTKWITLKWLASPWQKPSLNPPLVCLTCAVHLKVKDEERAAAEESAKASGDSGDMDGDDYDEGGYGEDMDEDMDGEGEGEDEGEEGGAGRDEL